MTRPPSTRLLDLEPATRTFFEDVVAGLDARPRTLPSKYFYDQRGSQLFERICGLDEYYLTRTELAIMEQHAPEMAQRIGPGVMLVEYGSGSSIKTRWLLRHLPEPAAYVPVDISRAHLQRSADELSRLFPQLEVLPVCADFTDAFELPRPKQRPSHTAVYFPGSTIGNFQPAAARAMLARIASLCGSGGGLLIGIDLQKDRAVLEAAYNDSAGVTAAFNLNLLTRLNRELDGQIDLQQFEHRAHYDETLGRIEMHLISRRDQTFTIGERTFEIAAGETICTEYSHKYTVDGFARIAAAAGLILQRHWTDEKQRFAVLHLVVG